VCQLSDIPIEIRESFVKHTTTAFNVFENTKGQCVALCAYIGSKIKDDNINCCIALGSLSCNGIETYEYSGEFPSNPNESKFIDWEGHAWIEFENRFIGEPSLIRTAKALPRESNVRTQLEKIDMLSTGAFLTCKNDALFNMGLLYEKKNTLNNEMIRPIAAGLFKLNNLI